MPVMNGPAATQNLRQEGCKVVVIGATGNVLSEDVSFFKSSGADDVFAKPLKVKLLEDFWQKNDARKSLELLDNDQRNNALTLQE